MPKLRVYLGEDLSLAHTSLVPALEEATLGAPRWTRPVPTLSLVYFLEPVTRNPVVEDIETGAWNQNGFSPVIDDSKVVHHHAHNDVDFIQANRWVSSTIGERLVKV